MLESAKEGLYANLWVIHARWYYISAILLLGFLANFDQTRESGQVLSPFVLVALFALGLFFNFLFYLEAKAIERKGLFTRVKVLAISQIATELVFLTGIMFAVAEFKTIVPVLFFIPIVESIVLFDRIGPTIVSFLSSFLINIVLIMGVFVFPEQRVDFWPLFLTNTAPITVVYIIIGFFASSLAHLLKGRGQALIAQTEEQATHVKDLEKLNNELKKKADELYAKDVELTLANQRLQTLEAAKSKFIAVTTHQLRTPLAAVKWTFDMVVKEQLGSLNAEQKEFLQKGYNSTQRIIAIVNDLLNVASFDKIEGEQMNFVPVKFLDLLNSVVFEFTNQSESKNIKLTVLKPSKELPLITLDPDKVRMVLENLIDNAIKYTPKNGTVTIIIDDAKINTVNPSIDVIVSDTGIGIGEEDQKKIFQKFYRAANAVQFEPDGTGLGLFIGRDIISKHHGAMWFVSEQGKGTKFYITLPVNQPKQ